ncbi:hypothetical protein BS50DRAFT_360336 [Corynespora cassiicola Philippines]|uniref:Protein kinase domain-containing protein n=1 Tax=Corynespora cassiicola Philippines TaxID=1448308 RepID=A0A2T2NS68_CORCC|nr:hypothetical protein BS50DRAFT_360336 [Corynespora cassiicola Philippines]
MDPPYLPDIDHLTQSACYLIIMCRCTRFNIEVHASNLENSIYAAQFSNLVRNLGNKTWFADPDDHTALTHWMMAPCLPHLRALPDTQGNVTLEKLLSHPIRHLSLHVQDGELRARRVKGLSFDMPYRSMWETVQSNEIAAYPSLPRIKGSDLKVLSLDPLLDVGCSRPCKVSTLDGQLLKFKQARSAFYLEESLEKAGRLLASGVFDQPGVRVRRFKGIVTSDDGSRIYGYVQEWLSGFADVEDQWSDLQDPLLCQLTAYHERWGAQVQATLQAVHAHNITWDAYSPGRIHIDKNNNAWLDVLGDHCDHTLVDRRRHETMDGDWQAFRNIFTKILMGERPVTETHGFPLDSDDDDLVGDGDDASEAVTEEESDSDAGYDSTAS